MESYRLQHRKLPGPIPELVLAFHNHEVSHGSGGMMISSTENILLGLMGGYRIQDVKDVEGQGLYDDLLESEGWYELQIDAPNDQTFLIKLNPSQIGNGPVVDGKMYDPISSGLEIGFNETSKQYGYQEGNVNLPDVLDGWGNPIVCFKRGNTLGQLVGNAHDEGVLGPQFYVESGWSYTRANYQHLEDACSDTGSLLSTGYPNDPGIPIWVSSAILSQLLRDPELDDDNMDSWDGIFSGDYIIISGGPDEIVLSHMDGPGSVEDPIGCNTKPFDGLSWDSLLSMDSDEFQSFNDIIMKR